MTADPYLCRHCSESLTVSDSLPAICAECLTLVACDGCGHTFPTYQTYAGKFGRECGPCEDKRAAGIAARDRAVGISEGRAAYLLGQGVMR